MFEQLLIPTAETSPRNSSSFVRPRKGVIIGAGQVGMACAYSLLIQNCLDEMVLQDIAMEKVEGEVMDLMHGVPFVEPTLVRAGTLADAGRDADLVIITAGASQKPGETRLNLLQRNVEIFKHLVGDLVKYCPRAIVLVVSNPVDILTYVTLKLSGLERSRVLGSGTVLDTARFRHLLAEQLRIAPRNIHAYIIGEHGDSEVAVWSHANIAGMPLIEGVAASDRAEIARLSQQVKNAAYEIIQRKGYTSYAIGLGVTEIVRSILRDRASILTVSSLIDNLYGLEDVCLSLPAVVDRHGVQRIVNLSLSEAEEQQLQHSALVLREAIAQLAL